MRVGEVVVAVVHIRRLPTSRSRMARRFHTASASVEKKQHRVTAEIRGSTGQIWPHRLSGQRAEQLQRECPAHQEARRRRVSGRYGTVAAMAVMAFPASVPAAVAALVGPEATVRSGVSGLLLP
jgi:hypothetical protein